MTDLNERIAALSPAQQAVLRQRLQNHRAARKPAAIARRPSQGPAPLSFAQERLWFLNQWEPDASTYNMPMGLRLAGTLNVPVLRRCLDEILRRHEPLRTRFEPVEGQPVQVIQPAAPLELPVADLTALPETEREAEAMRLCIEEARRPFDLRRDIPLRARLLRVKEGEHILLLVIHHIASDGWSMGLLFREMSVLYESFVQGKPSPLPELAIHYADFAVWQREWMQGEVLEEQLGYWKKQLGTAPALLDLPADRTRPVKQSYRGALEWRELPKPLSVSLAELGRRENATLFMTLLAAFQTLLHRYTGGNEILVGSPLAGRNRTDIEPLIGFFINTLVFQGDFSGNPSFRTLLGRTREAALGAYAHQDLPFEKLVKELLPQRDTSRSPFFQAMFVLQNALSDPVNLAGLQVTPIELYGGTAKFDLTLSVRERGERLQAVVEYSTDLFEADTIRRMLGHFQTLLEAIVSNPDQRVSELPLLTSAERRQLLEDWNRTGVDYPRDRCLNELFEAQVRRTPEATAVIFEGKKLTYRQLNERANQLAHYLQGLGVRPDTLVGICVDRSLEMMVGLLGILKAGGAYLPLDPAYPVERLAFMLEETEAPVLLAQPALLDRIPATKARVIRLTAGVPLWARESSENPVPAVRPENLAYVMYTSGSTGRPKGVEVPHRGVARLVLGADYARFDASRVFLQMAPISFDASTLEIWGALLHGATCVIAPPGVQTPQEIGQLVKDCQVTTLWLTTSLYNAIIDLCPSAISPVSELLFGGESASPAHVQRGLRLLPQTQLINGYGPTENTTFTCCYRLPKLSDRKVSSVPIGRPISNTRVYILDACKNPVPIGVAGELYIGGDGLARGYFKRPELTAGMFIPNPFSSEQRARLYRTGDLARWLPDGNIEFLGRTDHQVKIRGFRIELGEIESVLAALPGVREAVVLAREDIPGEKRLVAYLTAKREEPLKISELRGLLKAKLPEYMVPSAFVTLDKLPLTPNGKVDGKALPRPDVQQQSTGFVAPATDTEKTLANIWREVLELKQVGTRDNFFELGGHSLLAVRLQSRVETELGRKLPLAAFFQAPTIGELAVLLADSDAVSHGLLMTPQSSSEERPLLFYLHFLTQAQRLAKHLGPKWPVYAISAPLDEELRLWHQEHRLAISMEELAARCLPIIRRVQPKGPYRLGGGCFGGVLAFEIACQLQRLGEKVAFLALVDAFYAPGCRRLSLPHIRRWAYHGGRTLSEGIGYPLTKLKARQQLARKRRLLMKGMQPGNHQPGREETESVRLPQAEFMGEVQRPYRAKPYSGDVVLIRNVGEPSFAFDPGTTNGWECLIQGKLEVEELCCGHMDISEEPHIAKVAQWLEKNLIATEAGLARRTSQH